MSNSATGVSRPTSDGATVEFVAYLGDGEFDYCTVPMSDLDRHPTELGAAWDIFAERHPDRTWPMYQRGFEDGEPLVAYRPGQERDAAAVVAEMEAFFATAL